MRTPSCVGGMLSGHHWEKWEVVSRADLKISGNTVGRAVVQQRKCLLCGFTQQNFQRNWVDDRPAHLQPYTSYWERVFGHKANEA